MTTKPDLNRVWAEGAAPANIEDPDVTSPGKFDAGWTAEIPPFENFNFLQQLFTQGLAHANEYGIMQWDTATPYPDGAWTRSTVDDAVYSLIVGGNPANEPSANPADWATVANNVELKSGRKNSLINGRFAINQEAVSGTVILAANEFGHDMMFGGASGCTYTFSTTNNTTTIAISAGSLKQVVESANVDAGLNVLSWEGTAQGQIDGGGYGASGAVTATLTGGANVACEWNTGTLSLIQLEKGSYATDFEHRGIGEELALCHRYYWEPDLGTGRILSLFRTTTGIPNKVADISFPVTMRAVPSISSSLSLGTPSINSVSDSYVCINSSDTGTTGVCDLNTLTADARLTS